MLHGLLERLPVFTLDAARDAAGTGVVRHQHHVAAGQADEGGEGSTLVAALLLLDLDDDFLAFLQQLADVGFAFRVRIEILAGDFLQRQEAMTLRAVIDEAGFQGGFDAGDPAFVDIGLFLFAGRNLDVEIVEVLSVDDGHAQLFALSRVDQHTLHCGFLGLAARPRAAVAPDWRPAGDRAAAMRLKAA